MKLKPMGEQAGTAEDEGPEKPGGEDEEPGAEEPSRTGNGRTDIRNAAHIRS